MNILNFFEELWFTFLASPVVIKISVGFAVLNLAAFTILFTITYIFVKKRDNKEKIFNSKKEEHTQFIAEILSEAKLTETEILNRYLRDHGKLNKKAYLGLVPSLKTLLKENTELNLRINYYTLIRALKIDEYLEKKLDFTSIETRLATFHNLSRLKLTISDSKILSHTFSKNSYLRKGARSAYVGISNNNPFKFFDQADNNLNYWDQINLMQKLELHHKNNLPNFSNWIKYSKNSSQLTFLIRTTAYFQQYNSVNALISLLETDDHNIREEVIKALTSLKITKVETKLKAIYFNQPTKCQDAIIEAILNFNTQKSLEFFRKAFFASNNSYSKQLILEAIYLYGPTSKEMFDELHKEAKEEDKKLFEHIKNPLNTHRIKYAVEDYNIIPLGSRDEDFGHTKIALQN